MELINAIDKIDLRKINMTLIVLNIIIMIILVHTTIKNFDKVNSDPLIYGSKVHKIDFCNCLKDNGNQLTFNKTSIKEYTGWLKSENTKS